MAADEKLLAIKFPENDTEYVDSEPYLRNLMDDVEKRVEKLREQAIAMEQEKETILATLQKTQDNDLNLELSEGINTIFIILSISYIAISIKKIKTLQRCPVCWCRAFCNYFYWKNAVQSNNVNKNKN